MKELRRRAVKPEMVIRLYGVEQSFQLLLLGELKIQPRFKSRLWITDADSQMPGTKDTGKESYRDREIEEERALNASLAALQLHPEARDTQGLVSTLWDGGIPRIPETVRRMCSFEIDEPLHGCTPY